MKILWQPKKVLTIFFVVTKNVDNKKICGNQKWWQPEKVTIKKS